MYNGLLKKYSKEIRFVVSGIFVAVVGIVTLYIFTEWLNLWYLFSTVLSTSIAIIVNFVLQKFWTFEDKGKDAIVKKFSLFLLVSVLNIILNTVLMYVFVDMFHIWYITAQAFIMLLLSFVNYFLYGYIFK